MTFKNTNKYAESVTIISVALAGAIAIAAAVLVL